MYRRFLLFTTMILVCSTVSAQTLKKLSKKEQQQTIERLTHSLDSLQSAYDSLYKDYQFLLNPSEPEEDADITAYANIVSSDDYSPENIDSLLNLYYIQKNLDVSQFNFEVIERDTLTSSIPDSVFIARLNNMNSFIPLQWNRYVKNSIIRYTDKIPNVTQNILSLGTYYLPIFEEIFDMYDLPKELKALAVIESAFNPKAVSRANAKGMWQFMYTSAKQYGLQMNSFVDERFDPIASCHAAAKLLRDNYMLFGDWSLAIAAYNCGPGNVNKAIRRAGGKTDFWEIYQYLPRETRGYIPGFIAALYILQYYPEHGLRTKPIALPAHVDTFHINRMLHFQQISDNIGIPVEDLRNVNPQYIYDIVPGTEKEYVLRIPHNYSMAFVDNLDSIYVYKDSLFFNDVAIKKIKEQGGSDGQRIVHKVRNGETLGGIAHRYHTTVTNIKKWNGLKSNNIRVGQRLYIYGAASGSDRQSASASVKASQSVDNSGYVTYTVRKGDTPSTIASRNGVSLKSLLQLNGWNSKTRIYPGMKVRIKKAQ